MAERRMFSRRILERDDFLDLPHTTQILYIHLAMNADDDGFVDCARKVTRMVGAAKEDIELLETTGFLLSFENGLCAVTHWKIHNYIQKDRYRPTVYTTELKRLVAEKGEPYQIAW